METEVWKQWKRVFPFHLPAFFKSRSSLSFRGLDQHNCYPWHVYDEPEIYIFLFSHDSNVLVHWLNWSVRCMHQNILRFSSYTSGESTCQAEKQVNDDLTPQPACSDRPANWVSVTPRCKVETSTFLLLQSLLQANYDFVFFIISISSDQLVLKNLQISRWSQLANWQQ